LEVKLSCALLFDNVQLSFSQHLSFTKENEKGASLIGDTPFIIEKSMILHFYRDPSRKFSL